MHEFLEAYALAVGVALALATGLAGLLARRGFPLPPAGRRVGCIDGLRGYLALSVMCHHFWIWTLVTRRGAAWGAPSIPFVNEMGAGAVALFFMTTGLVFYPRIQAGWRATDWVQVYVSRVFRIVPLVVFAVAAITLIIIARTGATFDRGYFAAAGQWIVAWAEVPLLGYPDSGRINAYVLWSLWYEWLFYLIVLPLCAIAMDGVRRLALPGWLVPVGLIAVALAGRVVLAARPAEAQFFHYLPLFAIGMLAFEAQQRAALCAMLARPLAGLVAAAALLAGMILAAFPYGAALPLFGVFFICVACGNTLGGVLATRGALVLGECSFGIYLLHGIVLDLAFVDGGLAHARIAMTALPLAILPVVIAVVLTTAGTFLAIERPAMRLGKMLAQRLAARA